MKGSIIFPNQLFYPNPILSKSRRVFIIEDPLFFQDHEYPVKFHKQKLLLHLLSLDSYQNELVKNGYDVIRIDLKKIKYPKFYDAFLKENKITEVHYAELNDYTLNKRFKMSLERLKVKSYCYDTPGFINTNDEIKDYFFNKKRFLMSSFYMNQRKKLNILIDDENKPVGGKWSLDAENRKKLPKKITIPKILIHDYDVLSLKNNTEKISNQYNSNYGNLDSFNYPINRLQASKALLSFLKTKIIEFGTYEDAISKEHRFIFHSVLTPALNIGLITPKEIIDTTLEFSRENKIPLNSLEGFIRQIIGWREFIRGIYQSKGTYQRTRNFWGFNKQIPSNFYSATTGIEPVDATIKNVIKYAYGHHIERLMILGSIMCLLNYNPNSVYKWFMELFIDAYDWVMVPNVYGMSQFADGGIMSTKPYINGSNYILKMSNYSRGSWCNKWDALYWNFIDKHRSFFQKNPRMAMMVKLYDKKSEEQKEIYSKILSSLDI